MYDGIGKLLDLINAVAELGLEKEWGLGFDRNSGGGVSSRPLGE